MRGVSSRCTILAGPAERLKFDKPGVYQFDCSVDAAESVTVTVTG
jgi:hypothetical protein